MALTLDFTGKHTLVFGGTTGTGFGVAQNFSEHGANVSVASRKQGNVDAAMAAPGTTGGNIPGVAAFDAVGRAFDSAVSQVGTTCWSPAPAISSPWPMRSRRTASAWWSTLT